MTFDELKNKANSLPMQPGVYIMEDKSGQVIYVGKAKKLKNRVSQYFQDTAAHSPKTRLMVSKIYKFDVIVVASEFEALVLECSLIKRHMPKYNILLKDDKGYPYIRMDMRAEYPTIKIANKRLHDKAEYFGPFGSRGITNNALDTLRRAFQLPTCGKQFPRDIGKGRPCLNYHMGQCAGWCTDENKQRDYYEAMKQIRQLLTGHHKSILSDIRQQMEEAAQSLNFELAAVLRDRMQAVATLGQKQNVTATGKTDLDAIGYAQSETKACFAVLHFHNGNLIDKEYEIISIPDSAETAVSALVTQFYLNRRYAPRNILLPFSIEDTSLISALFEKELGIRTRIFNPQRGDNARMTELACKNAEQEVQRITDQDERVSATLEMLGKMINILPPKRIESYDISNTSGSDIVSSMVVFVNGKPKKSAYKHFKISGLSQQDDYASMEQTIKRRFARYINRDKGFDEKPDLLLIDGGIAHAKIAEDVLRSFGLEIPVFGMVKDDRHRTRALVTSAGLEIGISANQAVFSLIGVIQEETHRFAISYHRSLRSKRLKYSELDGIAGIGTKRKQDLLKKFKSISAISQASLTELKQILPQDAAFAVYTHFTNKNTKE